MASGVYRFENFTLNPAERQLELDAEPVELNARYLDALILLLREQGMLVTKERFLGEVWRGIPVTDEALTQCIRALRRQLSDSATRPRFIETVPKHGYRFIAPVEWVEAETVPGTPLRAKPVSDIPTPSAWRQFFLLGTAGTSGAGIAGICGGLFYGFASVAQPPQPDMGAVSILLVVLCLTVLVALIGGAGVAFGIAACGLVPGRPWAWSVVGGAFGGMVVGAVVKLLGLDAFNFLLGQSPGDITGAAEGLLLGGAVGFGIWLASRSIKPLALRRNVAIAALMGGIAGTVIPLLGGRLMGGSLDLFARSFPNSRLDLDAIGGLVGEVGFGPISQMVTGGLEGALFGGCIVGAMVLARRSLGQ